MEVVGTINEAIIPAVGAWTLLYTVPDDLSATLSTIDINNRDDAATNLDAGVWLAFAPPPEVREEKHERLTDFQVEPRNPFSKTQGWVLRSQTEVWVKSDKSDVGFAITGLLFAIAENIY